MLQMFKILKLSWVHGFGIQPLVEIAYSHFNDSVGVQKTPQTSSLLKTYHGFTMATKKFENQEKFIDLVNIGSFAIAFAHGKDAKIMKYPMKKTLDDRLDLWANQYFSLNTRNPFKILLKGDLHVFGVETGKFGTYINCPSIYGTSDYISLNYGITRPGALMINIPNINKEDICYKPIWLD